MSFGAKSEERYATMDVQGGDDSQRKKIPQQHKHRLKSHRTCPSDAGIEFVNANAERLANVKSCANSAFGIVVRKIV